MPSEVVYQAGLGGLLHGIGKVQVPDAIPNKPARLSPEESEVIKGHPENGHTTLSRVAGLSFISTRHHVATS